MSKYIFPPVVYRSSTFWYFLPSILATVIGLQFILWFYFEICKLMKSNTFSCCVWAIWILIFFVKFLVKSFVKIPLSSRYSFITVNMSSFWDICIANIYPESVGCLFIAIMIAFDEQKFKILKQYHIFFKLASVFHMLFKKSLPTLVSSV